MYLRQPNKHLAVGAYLPLYRCLVCNAIVSSYHARFGNQGTCKRDCTEKYRKGHG